MAKSILQSPIPALSNASPEFMRSEFDSAVYLKGYEVVIEKALRCPCNAPDSPLTDCQNCFGTGYFYVNPVSTHALITGINGNNDYKRWSEELIGTINVTVTDTDKPNMGYFDRITIQKEYSYFSENLPVRTDGENFFIFTTYKPLSIYSIHVFDGSTMPLRQLSVADYKVSDANPYCIILTADMALNPVVSVYYQHQLEFHVLDFPHEVRASWKKNKESGQLERTRLPIQAVARRTHLIVSEKPNFDGFGVILNDNIQMKVVE